ncbi:MAG: ferrous iron transport protein B [Deltaproteobacteria bacterium]|nr:ferrous iron transport protein B [Deltaproteobacteria bacterium]
MAAAAASSARPSSAVPASVSPVSERRHVVAVIGNPNTGKTTLFNALTGLTQHTGNYPGVTVESAVGEFTVEGTHFLAVDLPGTYSLAPRAPDEMIAVKVLLGLGEGVQAPDVVLCVLDATNLDRNLYLLTQVLEIGRPVVVALTMSDLAHKLGIIIDIAELEKRLGVSVVPVQANKRIGLPALRQALNKAARAPHHFRSLIGFPTAFTHEVDTLAQSFPQTNGHSPLPRFLIERLLIDAGGSIEAELTQQWGAGIRAQTEAARARLAEAGVPVPQVEVDSRYHWITQLVETTIRQPLTTAQTWTDRIDQVVTHKVWGLAVFLVTMAITFQTIFSWAVPVMDGIDALFKAVGTRVGDLLSEGPLRSLVVDGLIGGVGAVIVFVPQIAILFGLIALLEDSGYMARAAFLMDRVMASFGLSGRSFIPLLSSFACAVPGIMSTRSIDNRRDRIATILIAPLMSCSARLPVYVLLISAFIPARTVWGIVGLQGLTLFAMYLIGLTLAPPIAFVLKRTILHGEPVPFLLELPPFKVPAWRVVLFRMYDRSWAFLRRAGTIILATTVLVWALSYYPNQNRVTEEFQARRATASAEERAHLDSEEAGARLRESFLGQAGRLIEPIVQPLGWDWKIGMATLASFPAREVIIAALGTIYNLGSDQKEGSVELRGAMQAERWPDGRPVYTPVVALSLMVFFALCCQCGATLATIKRETGSWGYAVFTFTYMTGLAYLGALAVYQIGSRLV